MNWKHFLAASLLAAALGSNFGCARLARASWSSNLVGKPATIPQTIAGYKVKLVAVSEAASGAQVRRADHSWTPDGLPYEGSESRLQMRGGAGAPGANTARWIQFEIEQPNPNPHGEAPVQQQPQIQHQPESATNLDVFAYLPDNGAVKDDAAQNPSAAGPFAVQLWRGIARDSAGTIVQSAPASATMTFGVAHTAPQPVVFGIAQGSFHVLAEGAVKSIAGLAVDHTSVIASGPWGRIEATHLPMPQFQSRPSPTHRFRLLGGTYPPLTERKVSLFDAKGKLIATCGDGPNNPGSAGPAFFRGTAPEDISRFEIQERPYEFARFDNVSFTAPKVVAYSGQEGENHAVDSRFGKVLGVLKPKKDGAWIGSVLYAADGKRWIDPGQSLASGEFGMFDPWNHPFDDRLNILFEPIREFSSATTPIKCEVYAADSPTGPDREKLSTWDDMPLRMPMSTIPAKSTKRPYMRIEMRSGEGTWRTLQSIVVSDKMFKTAQTGSPGSRVLEVFFDESGSVRIWRDEEQPVVSRSTWHFGQQKLRVIAHLRDGRITEVNTNMSGFSGAPPGDHRYSGLEITRQSNGTHVQSGFKSLDIKDIISFEIQVQDLLSSVPILVHSPVN